METLEALANWLSDQDWGWWPFLHLRPRRDQRMTTTDVSWIALHVGPPVGLAAGAMLLALHVALRSQAFPVLLAAVLGGTGLFVPLYRATFAYCWNRRAARLGAGWSMGR